MKLTSETVRGLLRESAYGHPVREPRLIETHISWVVLTGPYAYKLKKPVNLGFLDFSTLALRKHFCEEEVRLNRRFAPELYLGVVPVTSRDGSLCIGGEGDAVDYAVRMRQFDESALLSRELEAGRFGPAEAAELGHWLARLHQGLAARSPPQAGEPGSPESLLAAVLQNFGQIGPRLQDEVRARGLAATRDWALARHRAIEASLRRRAALGFVRESHGDLHLRNIARLDGRLVPFDCIEFSEHFRVMDLQAELAMVVMDLEQRARRAEAAACFNAYLETSGDYDGVELTDFFRCYYALVRAKVLLLEASRRDFENYLDLARAYGLPRQPTLWLMHGLSGSGKTTVAGHLLMELDAVRIRSDVERKRQFGLAASAPSGSSAVHAGIYSAAATNAAYGRLADLARLIVRAGRHCIVDATFLDAGRRSQFAALAEDLRVPVRIVSCQARADTLRARVASRSTRAAEISEAGVDVLEHQLAHQDPLTSAEHSDGITVDTEAVEWRGELSAALGLRLAV